MAVMAQPAGEWIQGPATSEDKHRTLQGLFGAQGLPRCRVTMGQAWRQGQDHQIPLANLKSRTRAPLHPRSLPLDLNPSDATSAS
ncbi:hypothetical protein BN1723_000943 [Verticillium longisporum]|uniref:Uncharacterized protein n=1 Tax=Verticillium longisporum TaxID=100787 RepID=A0A0G4NCQ6_VERLO|nr:hypothetical protein BN1723_000943 [Verticillium longisporum]